MHEVTQILAAIERGEGHSSEELLPLVYEELRRLAAWHMAKEQPGQTLQATALVHEAWLRVSGDQNQHWDSRRHFFAAAAENMRRILVDRARRKQAVRHGGGLHRTELDEVTLPTAVSDDEVLAVHTALDALAAHDARKAELVKLHYFAGFTLEEAASALGISERTAKRDWAYARVWLYRQIGRP